ncbi:hypothetical protein ACFX14_039759 [Malus domestica]
MDEVLAAFLKKTKTANQNLASMNPQAADIQSKKRATILVRLPFPPSVTPTLLRKPHPNPLSHTSSSAPSTKAPSFVSSLPSTTKPNKPIP